MTPIPNTDRRWDWIWLIAVGVLSSSWCLTAAPQLSATFDETCYIERGLHSWRTGSLKPHMSAGTMPLPIDVQTLPIYLWERSRGQAFDVQTDLTEILRVGRAANLVFWWLLLVYAMKLARLFGGAWAGRMAVGLVGFDPNFVAHATLATTDISITATTLMTIYYFVLGRDQGWKTRVLIPGLCYGLAVVSKASALAFVPISFVVLGLFYHLTHTDPSTSRVRLRGLLKDLVHIVMVGSVFVFTYCGSDYTTERTFVEWARKLPEGAVKSAMVPVSENLRIFTNAGEAMAAQIKHNFRGHGVYLHGEWHARATWYYFPYALFVKLPLATLLLLSIAFLHIRTMLRHPLGWLALALLLFTLTCRVQIGIRLIFPTIAITYIAACITLTRSQLIPAHIRCLLAGGVIVANLAITANCWPHGLRFVNLLNGGPDEGYRALSDSNYDWGQGLPDLLPYTAPGQPPLAVWYYGTDPAAFRAPFIPMQLHTMPFSSPEDIKRIVGPARLAVGASILYGNPALSPSSKIAVDYLKTQTPIARTATFFIFDLNT